MKNGCRALFQAIALAIILLVFAWMPALAEGEFTTTLSSTYTVSATDVTRVTHDFVVTNTTPSYYIAKYGYQTSLSGITNIAVTNEGEALDSEVVSTDEKNPISFSFPNEVVGEGKAALFHCLPSPGICHHHWQSTRGYDPRTQKVPPTPTQLSVFECQNRLVNPTELIPDPSWQGPRQLACLYVYRLRWSGNYRSFGEVQRYQLDLTYYLDNPNNYRVITPITLPPDTTYQKLFILSLIPGQNLFRQMLMAIGSDYLLDATEQK